MKYIIKISAIVPMFVFVLHWRLNQGNFPQHCYDDLLRIPPTFMGYNLQWKMNQEKVPGSKNKPQQQIIQFGTERRTDWQTKQQNQTTELYDLTWICILLKAFYSTYRVQRCTAGEYNTINTARIQTYQGTFRYKQMFVTTCSCRKQTLCCISLQRIKIKGGCVWW